MSPAASFQRQPAPVRAGIGGINVTTRPGARRKRGEAACRHQIRRQGTDWTGLDAAARAQACQMRSHNVIGALLLQNTRKASHRRQVNHIEEEEEPQQPPSRQRWLSPIEQFTAILHHHSSVCEYGSTAAPKRRCLLQCAENPQLINGKQMDARHSGHPQRFLVTISGSCRSRT